MYWILSVLLLPFFAGPVWAFTEGVAGTPSTDPPRVLVQPTLPAQEAICLPYDVIFVMGAYASTGRNLVPEVDDPLDIPPASHLYKLKSCTDPAQPNQPAVLIDAGADGAILTPHVSYDAQRIFYSHCPLIRYMNPQRNLPHGGCNIMVFEIATGQTEMLVGQDVWRPRGSAGVTWSQEPNDPIPPGTSYLGYGLVHLSPVPLWNGDLFFVSNLNSLDITRGFTIPNLQGFILHADTGEIEQMWPAPTTLLDGIVLSKTGELVVATLENHLFGKPQRWGIWAMEPSGKHWRPLLSATMDAETTRHNCTEFGGDLYCGAYYFSNNNAMGTVLKRPLFFTGTPSGPEFQSERVVLNPRIPEGNRFAQHAYTPVGYMNVLPSHQFDEASHRDANGEWIGKGGFPWATSDGVLLAYSDGAANYVARPVVEAPHLYLAFLPGGVPVQHKNELKVVYKAPNHNIFYARSLETYEKMYGMKTPKPLPTRLANDGREHPMLPKGTSKALMGSSTVRFQNRESCGGQWPQGFECSRPTYSLEGSNMNWQGSDVVKYKDSEIVALQFIAQEGVPHYSYGPGSAGNASSRTFWSAHGNERLARVIDVPLIKRDKVTGDVLLDELGEPESSFLVELDGDVSYTMRLVRRDGSTLTHGPTWQPLRSGEFRASCGGCHGHRNPKPRDFATSIAGQPGFKPKKAVGTAIRTVEWHADVKPILTGPACNTCHNAVQKAGNIDFMTDTPITIAGQGTFPRNYLLVANDPDGDYSVKPIKTFPRTRSRFIDPHRAIDSLLVWVLQHKRGDYLTNDARPTEAKVGDVSTMVPAGAHVNLADIDYRAEVHQAHLAVKTTRAQQKTIIEWIDDGMPIDLQPGKGWKVDGWLPSVGWYADDDEIIVGASDVGTGIESVRIERDGVDVTARFTAIRGERMRMTDPEAGRYTVTVRDKAKNERRIVRLVE